MKQLIYCALLFSLVLTSCSYSRCPIRPSNMEGMYLKFNPDHNLNYGLSVPVDVMGFDKRNKATDFSAKCSVTSNVANFTVTDIHFNGKPRSFENDTVVFKIGYKCYHYNDTAFFYDSIPLNYRGPIHIDRSGEDLSNPLSSQTRIFMFSKNTTKNGHDGDDGRPGGNGANLKVYAWIDQNELRVRVEDLDSYDVSYYKSVNSKELFIDVSGGHGEEGDQGGDGSDGEDGECAQNGTIWAPEDGSPGGNGGSGGNGGDAGQITLIIHPNADLDIVLKNLPGLAGKSGESGLGGKGGDAVQPTNNFDRIDAEDGQNGSKGTLQKDGKPAPAPTVKMEEFDFTQFYEEID